MNMKPSNVDLPQMVQQPTNLLLVPDYFLETLIHRQDKILNILEGKRSTDLNGYITEKEAIQLLHKKATWFWQMRKAQRLPFKKIGNTVYYLLADINALLENNPL